MTDSITDIHENPAEIEKFLKIKIPEHLINLLKFHQFSSINILSELSDENITTIETFNKELLYQMFEGQEDEMKKYYGPLSYRFPVG